MPAPLLRQPCVVGKALANPVYSPTSTFVLWGLPGRPLGSVPMPVLMPLRDGSHGMLQHWVLKAQPPLPSKAWACGYIFPGLCHLLHRECVPGAKAGRLRDCQPGRYSWPWPGLTETGSWSAPVSFSQTVGEVCPRSCPHPPCPSFPSVLALPHNRLAGVFFLWQSSVFPSSVASLLRAAAHRPTSYHTSPRGLRCPTCASSCFPPPPPPVPSQCQDPTAFRPRLSVLPSLPFFPSTSGPAGMVTPMLAVPGQGSESQEQRPCPAPPPVCAWPQKGGLCFSMSHTPPWRCLILSERCPCLFSISSALWGRGGVLP